MKLELLDKVPILSGQGPREGPTPIRVAKIVDGYNRVLKSERSEKPSSKSLRKLLQYLVAYL